jgi:alpha-galactosidase
MQSAGYQYINLDDCWESVNRDAEGNLQNDPEKFPSGIPALATYFHQLGLKLGIYEDMGTVTCGGRAGSYGHYEQDIKTFAAWGVDYVKMDWCNTDGLDPKTQYTQFAAAMADANVKMTYSICEWGIEQPWKWAPAIANLWRTSPDIGDEWVSMLANLDAASQFAAYAAPGAWNDPDMLEVGNGGMTDTEDRTHFSMWAMLSAPLIAGNDIKAMSATTLATLTNSEVIAVDQDPLGKQARFISDDGTGLQVWSKQVTGGTVVALFNRSAASAAISVDWSEIGLDPSQSVAVRDIWAAQNLGEATGSFSALVPSHGVTLLKLSALSDPPVQSVYEANGAASILRGSASAEACPGANGSSCLDGYLITGVGSGTGNSITIRNIDVASSGTYNLLVYAGVYPSLTYDVSVNGDSPTLLTMSGPNFGIPAASGLQVHLNAGANSIEFSNPTQPAPDLDHILISGPVSTSAGFDFVYPGHNLSISAAGQSGTVSVSLAPVGGFSGEVQVTCALPAAMVGASCSSATVNLQGGTSANASLVITTTAPNSETAAISDSVSRSGEQPMQSSAVTPRSKTAGSARRVLAFLLPLPALGLWMMRRRGSVLFRGAFAIFWIAGLFSVGTMFTACGSNAPKCVAIPSAPTSLSATATGATSTTLSWKPATVTGNCAIANYSVYQNNTLISTTDSTSLVVKGLTPSTQYVFKVMASDAAGSSSEAAINIKTLAPPPLTPTGSYTVSVTATSGSVTKSMNLLVTVQ